MNIAFVSQPFDYVASQASASVTIWTNEIARRLAASDEVVVYGRRSQAHDERTGGHRVDDGLQPVLERADGVEYRRVPTGVDRAIFAVVRRMYGVSGSRDPRRPLFGSPFYYPGYGARVAVAARRRRHDIVHIHNFSQFLPAIRRLHPGGRRVLHMHCTWLLELPPHTVARRLRHADLIIGCSDYITEGIRRAFPDAADRCRTVYNGVDVEAFASTETAGVSNGGDRRNGAGTAARLLFVGRIAPQKGLDVLLQAFEIVAARSAHARLEVVGPDYGTGPEGSYLERLRGGLPSGLRDRVAFTGFIPHGDLAARYHGAALLVAPGVGEGFGMPLVEAMAAGVPVVAAHSGGMAEIVEDGRTGVLVEPGNPQALAETILGLVTDSPRRLAMAAAARRRAIERFGWDRIVADLRAAYQDMLEAPRR